MSTHSRRQSQAPSSVTSKPTSTPDKTKGVASPSKGSGTARHTMVSVTSPDDAPKPQHGRRSSRRYSKFGEDKANKSLLNASTGSTNAIGSSNAHVKDAVPENLTAVADEDLNGAESAALLKKQREEKARLAQAVAEAPTGYQAPMPRLTDLDIKNNWDRLLQSVQGEFDMSCLTACLAPELDDDVAWNPEMLLVQLTSDMHDAAELTGDEANFVPVDDSEIGLMKGGEVTRKRKEKGSALESPQVPPSSTKAAAAAAAAAASSKNGSPSRSRKSSNAESIKSSRKKSVTGETPRKLSAKESSSRKVGSGASNKASPTGRRKSKSFTSKASSPQEL